MKRIRKVIASALTLVMSILVMCVGVYAAASAPKVSISGSISYDVGACKVRVTGNLSGAYTDANGSGTTPVAKTQTDNNSQACHYYGVHDNAQSETNMLPAWGIGSVYFKETADGAESFVITLKVENLSVYPIKATVNNTATEVLTNVEKSVVNNDVEIAIGESQEIQIKYDVQDSSKTAVLTIGNELVFTKVGETEEEPTPEPEVYNLGINYNCSGIVLSVTVKAYVDGNSTAALTLTNSFDGTGTQTLELPSSALGKSVRIVFTGNIDVPFGGPTPTYTVSGTSSDNYTGEMQTLDDQEKEFGEITINNFAEGISITINF